VKFEFPRQITEKYSNVNVDEIVFSESRGRTYGQTDRQMTDITKLTVTFRKFRERALKLRATWLIDSTSKLKGSAAGWQ